MDSKLNSMLRSEDDEIKKQILLLAYEKNNFIDEDLLLNLSKQDDQIGASRYHFLIKAPLQNI